MRCLVRLRLIRLPKKILAYTYSHGYYSSTRLRAYPPHRQKEMATTTPIDPQQRREAILQQAIELLPNMVFAKDAAPQTRDDYDRGFRCALSLTVLCVCVCFGLGGGEGG